MTIAYTVNAVWPYTCYTSYSLCEHIFLEGADVEKKKKKKR